MRDGPPSMARQVTSLNQRVVYKAATTRPEIKVSLSLSERFALLKRETAKDIQTGERHKAQMKNRLGAPIVSTGNNAVSRKSIKSRLGKVVGEHIQKSNKLLAKATVSTTVSTTKQSIRKTRRAQQTSDEGPPTAASKKPLAVPVNAKAAVVQGKKAVALQQSKKAVAGKKVIPCATTREDLDKDLDKYIGKHDPLLAAMHLDEELDRYMEDFI